MKESMMKLLIVLSSVVVASACTWSMDPDYGQSVATNTAVQTIDHTAGMEDEPVATLDGQKGKQVIDSYHKEKGKAETGTIINIGTN